MSKSSKSLSKHGTLDVDDLEDVREIDVDKVFEHKYSNNTSRIFGKVGLPPPDDAVVMERRYTRVWIVEGEKGENYIGLTKANSATKGQIDIPNLAPGQYKLAVRIFKPDSTSVMDIATKPVGAILSNLTALSASSQDRKDQILARGMPTEYVQVHVLVTSQDTVTGEEVTLMDNPKEELDQARDEIIRTFTVKNNCIGRAQLNCSSFSLVKRMRLSAELFRCDLPSLKDLAKQGRAMMSRGLSSSGRIVPPPPPPPPPQQQPAAATTTGSRKKRSVLMDERTDVWIVLQKFYALNCPEKVGEIPQIISYFHHRDGHLGILFATLEDKYKVKFNPDGTWQ